MDMVLPTGYALVVALRNDNEGLHARVWRFMVHRRRRDESKYKLDTWL